MTITSTMKFCSYGQVIDALLAIPGTDALGSGYYLASGDPVNDGNNYRPAVQISDGPWTTDMPLELVAVGISATDMATGQSNPGTQTPGRIGGALVIDEEYDVLSWIRVYDGDGAAQKKVRDRALQLFSVFEFHLRSRPTLGLDPLLAYITMVDLNQDDPLAGDGSIAWLAFNVHIKHTLVSA